MLGHNLKDINHVDDILIADSKEKMKELLVKVDVESKKKGHIINFKKLECIMASKRGQTKI